MSFANLDWPEDGRALLYEAVAVTKRVPGMIEVERDSELLASRAREHFGYKLRLMRNILLVGVLI